MSHRFLSRPVIAAVFAFLGAGAPAGAETFLTVNNQTSRNLSLCQPGPGSPGLAPGAMAGGCPCAKAWLAPSHCLCLQPGYLTTCTLDASESEEEGKHSYLVIRNLPEGAVFHFRGLTLAVAERVPPGLRGPSEACPGGAKPAKDGLAPDPEAYILDAGIQSELH